MIWHNIYLIRSILSSFVLDYIYISLMSTPQPVDQLDPNRPLTRAKPLWSASDQLDAIIDRDGTPGPSPNGFGSSFRLHGFKASTALERSRSLSTRKKPYPSSAEVHQVAHSRSLSYVDTMQAGAASTKVPSGQKRGPTLSAVLEGGPTKDGATTNHKIAQPPSPALSDIKTLHKLRRGTLLTKVSAKKQQIRLFRLEADLGQIVWVSKSQKISKYLLYLTPNALC